MLNESQNVVHRLELADRGHQMEAGGRVLFRSVKYFCALLLGAFALDVAFHLRPGWRLGLLLALVGGAILLGIVAAYIAFVRRNRLEHIARLLESRDPALGSRLINLLQLRDQTNDTKLAPLTREMARQAVEQYSVDLKKAPLERLAWKGDLRRHFGHAALAVLVFAAILGAFFRVTAVEVARFVDPYGDHPPYSFTRLEVTTPGPGGTNVLYGKGLVVKVKAAGHRPKEVFLEVFPIDQPGKAVTSAMFDKGSGTYDQLVDNIRGDVMVRARTKDGVSISKQARISVLLTPKLEKAFVQVTPPAYTGLKPEEKPYSFGAIQALEKSEIRFRLQSNRPLRDGVIEVSTGDQQAQHVSMAKSAEHEVSGSIIAADSSRLRFAVVDVAGLPSQDAWDGALTVTHDLAPEIRISEPEHDGFVAIDFKLKVHVDASDDYGLKTIRIHRGVNTNFVAPKVVTYDSVVRSSTETVDLNFEELGVQPEDIVSIFAEAIDTAPEPHLSRSQVVRLRVISVEAYNDFLRQNSDLADVEAKYSELLEDLQELIENQKALGESAEKLKDQVAKAKPRERDALAQQLDDLMAKQNELNEKLNKHAERMENFVRDDPLYDIEQELQQALNEQAELIRKSTKSNEAANKNIAQRSSPESGARQVSPDMPADFKKASDEQLARLGPAEKEGQEEIVQTLQDMEQMQELLKDFNQFEALYRAQQELAAQAQAYRKTSQLTREDQLALKDMAATEKQVGDLLEELEQKLREDAKAAEEKFPKAAQSGRDLADAIDRMRLSTLARQATGQMLAGNGERAFHVADRLRGEMEKLFSECQGGNCPSQGELDSYLTLQRALKAGRNFAQMSRSQKFGSANGKGRMGAQGDGFSGTSGYAVMGQSLNVIGNERSATRGSATARQTSRAGKGAGTLAALAGTTDRERADVIKGLTATNRQSGVVASEATIEEYSEVVDHYFKAITTRRKP